MGLLSARNFSKCSEQIWHWLGLSKFALLIRTSQSLQNTLFSEFTAWLTQGKHRLFSPSQKFSLISLYFPRRRIQVNSRKRMFSNVHRPVNVRKLWCDPAFLQVFSCFSCIFPDRANTREFKKTPVLQCSPHDELWENILFSRVRRNFLVFSGSVSSGECRSQVCAVRQW